MFCSLEKYEQEEKMKNFIFYLEENNATLDIKSYRKAKLSLRI